MPAGRPSDYNLDLAQAICNLLADGNSLQRIGKMPGMPEARTIIDWVGKHAEFAQMYVRAREAQAQLLAAEIIEISDTPRKGKKVEKTEKGRECSVCGGKVIWHAGKWAHQDKSVLCEGASVRKVIETKTVVGDTVERSRLMVDTRKWVLAKVLPRVYGDRLQVDSNVKHEFAPEAVELASILSPAELLDLQARLKAKRADTQEPAE